MNPKVYGETTNLELFGCATEPAASDAGTAGDHAPLLEDRAEKYNLVVSEVVEAECGRGDAESASRRRELLGEVSLFPLNGRILELARLLVVPGAIPEKAGPRCSSYRRSGSGSVKFYLPETSGI